MGGMGEVWTAYHGALKRDVAVKLLPPGESSRGDMLLKRFEREVAAMSELSHPNTVRVFDYGVTADGIWYYAMELLDGCTLTKLVQREGPLSPARAIHLANQMSRALAEAHERGIFHRDIKPDNVFVSQVGSEGDIIKVLDFGIAKLAGGEQDGGITQTGAVFGTPSYISPEAVLSEKTAACSDVYGLGAVLYYMLTGSAPFVESNPMATMMAHVNKPVQPPSERLGRPLPEDLEAVVMRCLNKAPRDRFSNARVLSNALLACEDAAGSPEMSPRSGRADASPSGMPTGAAELETTVLSDPPDACSDQPASRPERGQEAADPLRRPE